MVLWYHNVETPKLNEGTVLSHSGALQDTVCESNRGTIKVNSGSCSAAKYKYICVLPRVNIIST